MKTLVAIGAVLMVGLFLGGCSGQGEDVVDPGAGERDQTALLALGSSAEGDLGRYNEISGVVSTTEYSDLNGGESLPAIDGMYEAFDQIYLHHNSLGRITVVDAKTRVKMAEIDGFPRGDEGELCGMAFSNLSQAWAIANGSKFLYLIDAQNLVLVPPIPLPDNPTAVATSGNRVFVAMEREDKSAYVAVIRSNNPDFEIERTIDFSMPIVYGASNPDGAHVVFIGSGDPGTSLSSPEDDTKPKVFIVNLADYSIVFDRELNTSSLHGYIGEHPMFAGISRNFYCYVATPEALLRIDTKSWGQILDWIFGPYRVVGVDYFTDLVYAVPANAPTRIDRITLEEDRLPEFSMSEEVKGILFISTSTIK